VTTPDKLAAKKRWSVVLRLGIGAIVGAAVGIVWGRLHAGSAAAHQAQSFRDMMANFERAGFTRGVLISYLLLIVFSLYWEKAAANASENKTAESRWSRGIHLALASAGQLLVLMPVPGLRARFLPWSILLVVLGLWVEAAGILFAVWARRSLGRNWSGAVAIKVDQQLVRSGPYRFVRHPIYSGLLGMYLGLTMVSGEVHALAGMVLVCAAYWRKIRLEEDYLGGLFGAEYDEYRNSTRAIVPGVW